MARTLQLTVGILALQGGFHEHADLLKQAADNVKLSVAIRFVRTIEELKPCDALIIPGGESTTIMLLAKKSGLLPHLQNFVKQDKKPVWGTCAGMICLSEEIYRDPLLLSPGTPTTTIEPAQQPTIGGVDLVVVRNQYGRQVSRPLSHTERAPRPVRPPPAEADSFCAFATPQLKLASFEHGLAFRGIRDEHIPFPGVFIRAPIVHHVLDSKISEPLIPLASVPTECLPASKTQPIPLGPDAHAVALQQGNRLVTSFHPELSTDPRVHEFFLGKLVWPSVNSSQ